MSHADEGRLHAYLDGELSDEEAVALRMHLQECEPCRSRLEEARRIVGEADAVLATAPELPAELPALAEMEAEAARRRSAAPGEPGGDDGSGRPVSRKGRGAAGSLQRLAWAASVVVALGVGWMAREMAAPATPAGPAVGTSGRVQEATQSASDMRAARPQAPPAAGESEPGDAEPGDASEGGGVGEEVVENLADADVLADAAPPEAEPQARQGAATDVAPDAAGLGDRPAELTRLRAAPEASRRTADAGFTSAARGELGVPGLPILEVTRRPGSPDGTVLSILHRLPEGDTLEVLHLMDGAEVAGLPEPASGIDELVVDEGDGPRVLRARRSLVELEALANRGGG